MEPNKSVKEVYKIIEVEKYDIMLELYSWARGTKVPTFLKIQKFSLSICSLTMENSWYALEAKSFHTSLNRQNMYASTFDVKQFTECLRVCICILDCTTI